jgi:Flp pilus assembly protein TadG
MMSGSGSRVEARGGFLTRLARDRRGNTIAMMAAFLIPLSALVGSAVDIARLYVVKVRIQQACDAGVLAGRKFMTDSGTTLDPTATTQANNFFANNFKIGWMGTSSVAFTPVKTADNQVAGTASVVVPMTVMKMFSVAPTTLAVTCQARYDVADTDVMFVLDTTGSMACLPGGPDTCGTGTYSYTRPTTSGGVPGYAGSTGYAVKELTSNGSNVSRIDALRKAVLTFYDTFAANADPATHVRYGFVTYSSSVNVGQAILDKSPSYLVGSGGSSDMPYYQSRHVYADYTISTSDSTPNNRAQSACNGAAVRDPAAPLTYYSSGTATSTYYYWKTTGGYNSTSYCVQRVDTLGPRWEYKQLRWDISALVNGATSITDPTAVDGSKTQWLGCVETKVDNPGQTSFTTSSLPSELNPDLKPTGDTRWWPHLQDIEYWRTATTDYSNGDDNNNRPSMGSTSLAQSGYTACGKPAKRLGEMLRSDVYNYLYATDFVPQGGTYHDTGMIWGARMISPTGAWADDTATWAGRNPPNRVIVFLTDGVMAPNSNSYSMYGYEDYDKRVGNGNTSNLNTYHTNRFLAACAAAKARNVDIWTVELANSASTPMQTCATTANQALYTTTGGGISAAFTTIAQHLAMLRITK